LIAKERELNTELPRVAQEDTKRICTLHLHLKLSWRSINHNKYGIQQNNGKEQFLSIDEKGHSLDMNMQTKLQTIDW